MKTKYLFRLVFRSLLLLGLLTVGSRGFAQTPAIPLSVNFYYPTNGQTFTAPATIGVHASILDSTLVETVQYFANGTNIAHFTNSSALIFTNSSSGNPFEMNWSNVLAGTYTLTAVVTDAGNTTVTSAPVNITVQSPPPPVIRPSVYLYSPTNGAEYLAPANLTLYARAGESTGAIATVQFFAGDTSLGIVTNSTGNSTTAFSLAWSNVLAGSYALKALATDALGMSSTSAVVTITVVTNFPPPPVIPLSVSFYYPTNGQTFTNPATIGVHAKVLDSTLVDTVQYFANGTNIASFTNSSAVVLTNSSAGNPFEFGWSNVLAGTYALTAVVTDAGNTTVTSAPVNITVRPPPPPPVIPLSVSFYYPTNGQIFTAPATIAVHALVLDSTLVNTVQYFANGVSIGTRTNSSNVVLTNSSAGNPFELNWSNVLAGPYALTAVATDAGNNSVTSAPVNLTVLSPPPPPPIPFAVSFWYPTNRETFTAPASIGVHALVTDSNLVTTMAYFSGTTNIGIVTNKSGILLTNTSGDNPFYLLWSNVLAGSYTLTAVATDSAGLMATSPPVTITVLPPPPPPVIPLIVSFYYPTNGQTFTAPATIGVHALVLDSTLVDTVQYFANGTNIGSFTNSSALVLTNSSSGNPFEFNWSNVVAGTYRLTAVAVDAGSITVTSAPVTITVLPPPPPPVIPLSVSFYYPTNGQTFTAPATIGVHAKVLDSTLVDTVQYFANGVSIGTRTNTAGLVLTNSSMDNPFFLAWSNVLAGTYALTAVATDAGNTAVTSAPVNITVLSPPPPVIRPSVYLYSPTNGAEYLAPANLTLYARAGESTGAIATVQFFAGDTSLGIVTNSTGNSTTAFSLAWSNVLAGSYALKALATDALGMSSTSTVVNITVVTNFPPPPVIPLTVGFLYPTNGQTFTAPATIGVHAKIIDSTLVETVEYFANGTNIASFTNSSAVVLTNSTGYNPFELGWSNVSVGTYALTAVVTDAGSTTVTSAPVNITVLPPPPPPVIPLSVSFYYPTNGQTFTAPATIGVHAKVLDSTLVDTVQYFANGVSIGTRTNTTNLVLTNSSMGNPFFLAWSNVLAGTYVLTAVAADAGDTTVTSAPITITVLSPPPPPPIPFAVSFWYPTNGEIFTAPANIGVHARVTDSNLVTTVAYFSGTTNIGIATNISGILLTNTSTESPFYLLWSNVLAGSYTLTAVATDSTGLMATSPPVTITVQPPPPPPVIPLTVGFYYPTNGQVFTTPAIIGIHASILDSTLVETVQYFANGTNIAHFTNSSALIFTNSSSGNPFEMNWSNVLAGTYTLTAVVTDAGNTTGTSAPVTITVQSPPPPVIRPSVYLYSPTNGAEYLAPANLTLYARAGESTGAIATVQFFAGDTSLGIVTNSTGNSTTAFSLAWSNVLAGSYALKALATDALGMSSTSAVVTITVVTNFPPPPVIPLSVSFYYPTNGQTFTAPATIGVHAKVMDSTLVDTVQYFANGVSIGTRTNTANLVLTNSSMDNPFFLAWSNVVAGTYALTAVATDAGNTSVTSAPVTITVQSPPPPVSNVSAPMPVTILNPANSAPHTVSFSFVTQSGSTHTVQYKDTMTAATWTTLTTISGNGSATNVVDTTATTPTRVYRVITQ